MIAQDFETFSRLFAYSCSIHRLSQNAHLQGGKQVSNNLLLTDMHQSLSHWLSKFCTEMHLQSFSTMRVFKSCLCGSTDIPLGADVSGLDSTGIDCSQSSDESENGNGAREESDDSREMEQELLRESINVLSSDSEATSEDDAMKEYSSSCSDEGGPTHSAGGRGHSRGQGRGRGRGCGFRMGRGGGRGRGRRHGRRQIDLRWSAVAIRVTDSESEEEDVYSPLRETEPQIPGGSSTELDLLSQFFSEEMIERLASTGNK